MPHAATRVPVVQVGCMASFLSLIPCIRVEEALAADFNQCTHTHTHFLKEVYNHSVICTPQTQSHSTWLYNIMYKQEVTHTWYIVLIHDCSRLSLTTWSCFLQVQGRHLAQKAKYLVYINNAGVAHS